MSSRSAATCRSATGCGRRSPGYPGHAAYRDFHTYDHVTGLKPARVTGRNVPSDAKAPYDPVRAEHAVDGHVADFVDVVRRRLVAESGRIGRPAHVIAAFDTELFGHWWYEGPVWLETVLRALPAAGIRVGTLSDAVADGFTGRPVELPPSSWGSGKDWSVWSGEKVADLVQLNTEVVDTALSTVDKAFEQNASVGEPVARDVVADQILRETLLTVSSDWPFMVSKDSAADYARYRAHLHAHATREIAGALAIGPTRAGRAVGGRLEPCRRPVRRARRTKAPPRMTSPRTVMWGHPRTASVRVCTATRRELVAFCARSRSDS